MAEKKDDEANINMVLAVKKAAGDKSVYNFITGGGLGIGALGVGLMFTGVGLPIGIGMFALGELIAAGAAYLAHQSQKELDSLGLSQTEIKNILKVEPQVVIEEDDVKPQTTVEEDTKLSAEAKELEADKSVYNFIKYLGMGLAVLGIVLAVVTGGASLVGLFIGLGMIAVGGAVALGFDNLSRQVENNLDALPQKGEVEKERPQIVEKNPSISSTQATIEKEAAQGVKFSSDVKASPPPSATSGPSK